MDQAADLACREISPINDVRATASFRRTVTRAYVVRGLNNVLDQLETRHKEGMG